MWFFGFDEDFAFFVVSGEPLPSFAMIRGLYGHFDAPQEIPRRRHRDRTQVAENISWTDRYKTGTAAAVGSVDVLVVGAGITGFYQLVNNAGIMRWGGMRDIDVDQLEQHLAVHVVGSFNTTLAAWPHMVEQSYGGSS